MFEVGREWDLPVVGKRTAYLSGHDEVHSLSARYPQADVRFWMGFGEHYINVFTVLQKLGLLSEQPVTLADGTDVVPLKVVKAVLPDPASLAPTMRARPASATWSAVPATARRPRSSSTTSPTTRRPSRRSEAKASAIPRACPVAAAILIARGPWDAGKMANVEDLPARPFLELLGEMGLPTRVIDASGDHPV